MQYIKQDILQINRGIIVHQVNTKGVMGAGLAKQIKDKYPQVYKEYREACIKKKLHLGIPQYVTINQDLIICNLPGQKEYGRNSECYTNYEALDSALRWIQIKSECSGLPIYTPYKIGCGLAGGDWNIVEGLISKHCPNAVICQL